MGLIHLVETVVAAGALVIALPASEAGARSGEALNMQIEQGSQQPSGTYEETDLPSIGQTHTPPQRGMTPTQDPGMAPAQDPGMAPTQQPGMAPTQQPGTAPTQDPGMPSMQQPSQPSTPTQPGAPTSPFMQQTPQQREYGEPQQGVALQGVLRGVVSSVDLDQGTLTIRTDRGTATFRAQPRQLVGVRPGEQYAARFTHFGEQMWLADEAPSAQPLPQFGDAQNLTGILVDIDRTNGAMALATAPNETWIFLAHPSDLQQLVPGQYVSVSFQRIGSAYWLHQVAPGGRMQAPR